MNKSESKYFNTAVRMDEAFLTLLEQKDFEYITVKEICAAASVNRSTFYLHYETLGDLMAESLQYLSDHFYAHMRTASIHINHPDQFLTCPVERLYLTTPEYLTPYLEYIKAHRRLFRTALERPAAVQADRFYLQMFRDVFTPILERFQIPEQDRHYLMAFYIQGLTAIVSEWLKQDCSDSIDHVTTIIQQCVAKPPSILQQDG